MSGLSTVSDTFELLFSASALLFSFWPVVIFAPLQRRGSVLRPMLTIWVLLALVRGLLVLRPLPFSSFLLPEPLNTLLFFVAGVVLLVLNAGGAMGRVKPRLRKEDGIQGISDLLDMSPREFEELIVELYRGAGHRARRTGAIGDHGIDIVIEAKNGEKWVAQCKRWRGSVGAPVVRDFYGAMQHEKADKGALVTTGSFTAQARDWARGKPITLYDGKMLLEALDRYQARQRA